MERGLRTEDLGLRVVRALRALPSRGVALATPWIANVRQADKCSMRFTDASAAVTVA